MIRTEYAEKIEQYILQNPQVSFKGIYDYATEIEATDEEIQEGIFLAKKILQEKGEDINQNSGNKKHTFHYIQQAIFAFFLFYIGGVGILLVLNAQPKKQAVVTNTQPKASSQAKLTQSSNNVLLTQTLSSLQPRPVYANQLEINAQQTFSYPASPITLQYSGTPKREVLGFFPYWMLQASDKIILDPYTTVALFGLTLNGTGDIITKNGDQEDGGWAMWRSNTLDQFIIRLRNKRIKTLITIKCFNNTDIENVIASDESQKRAIANIVELTKERSLQGVNIDFEYVGRANPQIAKNFIRFIANLNSELEKQIPGSELSIDTYLSSGSDTGFFDIQLLEPHLDSIVVMGYDVHTLQGSPGPVAPFEGSNGIVGYMQSYLDRIPASKLILALPYYGYNWIKNGDTTSGSGIFSYAQITSENLAPAHQWDVLSSTPFFTYTDASTNNNHIVYFDNSRSLGIKYDYINNKNLKGLGIWAMGYEGNNQELSALILQKFAQ